MTRPEFSSQDFGWQAADATAAHGYLLPAITKLLPRQSEQRILDLGCGNGFIASRLAAMGNSVTALDPAPDAISLASKAYPDVHFKVASVYDDLEDVEGGFDVLVSSEVIEHLYSPRVLVERAYQKLRPGGAFILSTPYHGYFKNLALSLFNKWDDHFTVLDDGWHIKFFSPKTLSTLIRSVGFINLRFHNVGRMPLLWKAMVLRAEKPLPPSLGISGDDGAAA